MDLGNMRVWFTEIGEPLPLEKDVRLHRYGVLTRSLTRYGHEVTWWTSGFSHMPKRHIVCHDTVVRWEGVTIRLLKGLGYKRNVSATRVMHQLLFARKFYRLADECEQPDVIVTPIPTLEVAKKAILFGRRAGIPVIVDIRDEWPDELVDLAPRWMQPWMRLMMFPYFRAMSYICRNAEGIIGVSRSCLHYGLSFAGREASGRDMVLPIGYRSTPEYDRDKVEAARRWWREQGVRVDAFVCCFFGTIGNFFDLNTVIRAARILQQEFDLQMVLCGDGSRLDDYKDAAVGLDNVLFPGWVDEPKIVALMQLAHVGLAPYGAQTRMSLPNKPFEYFAGGLPVVSSIQGELKEILAQYDCGRTYDPDSEENLCAILRELHASPAVRLEMGCRGRRLLEERFSSERVAESLHQYLLKIVNDFQKTG
jgi:glycosyltransferase involved in cell wall biosynthesis